MHPFENAELSLEQARRRFAQWRRRNCYGRIPHELWLLASRAAVSHGAELTAASLGLNVERLNQWVQRLGENRETAETAEAVLPSDAFIELPPLNSDATSECTLELEEPSGRKLRISLKGAATRQALELGRMLWRSPP
jgi:hypothetical protein